VLKSRTELARLGCGVAAAVVFFTANAILRAQSPLVRTTGEVIARLESEIPGLMQQAGVPGMSIALVRGGKTVSLHEFGVKDKKTGDPVKADTVFEAASLSKPVFAYGVLKLVEERKLDLDTPPERIPAEAVRSGRTGG
jgi:CubicO group peptidase (beta-lactamase class C family)